MLINQLNSTDLISKYSTAAVEEEQTIQFMGRLKVQMEISKCILQLNNT